MTLKIESLIGASPYVYFVKACSRVVFSLNVHCN